MKSTFLFLLGLALPAGAQTNRDFFPWWDMPISRTLNLSEDQRQKIQSTVREYRDRLVDLRAAVEKSENQLSDLINDEHPDAAKVNAAIDRSVAARGELTRAFSQMGFRLRLVLTPAQWQDLQRRRMERMPPGPNGQPRPRMNRPNPGDPGPPNRQPEEGEDRLDAGPNLPNRGNIQNPRPRVFHAPDQRPDHLIERN